MNNNGLASFENFAENKSNSEDIVSTDDGAHPTLRNIDEELNHLIEVFPDVDPDWVRFRLVHNISIEILSEWLCAGAYPKKPKCKPEQPKKTTNPQLKIETRPQVKRQRIANDPIVHNYFKLDQETSSAYRKAAVKTLANDFRQVSMNSINRLFAYFNFHYAPVVKCIGKAVKRIDLKQRKGTEIRIQNQTEMLYIKILVQKRQATFVEGSTSELNAEIDWVRKNMENFLQEGAAGAEQPTKNCDLVVCNICWDEYNLTEMVPCRENHLFCIECVRNHAKESVYGQAKAYLTCMESSCNADFSRAALELALDETCLAKLDERALEENINLANIDNLVRCKHCNYALIMDIPIEVDKVFKCGNPQCQREVCRLCGVDWNEHFGIPCEELETQDETRLRKQMEEKMAETIIRRCHRCKVELIKDTGCNKMTCRCGAKMCYVCRQPDISYDHFCHHFRSPGQPCTQCKLCSMWEDTNKLDKKNLQKVQNEANEAQEALGRKRQIGVDDKQVPFSSRMFDGINSQLNVANGLRWANFPFNVQQAFHNMWDNIEHHNQRILDAVREGANGEDELIEPVGAANPVAPNANDNGQQRGEIPARQNVRAGAQAAYVDQHRAHNVRGAAARCRCQFCVNNLRQQQGNGREIGIRQRINDVGPNRGIEISVNVPTVVTAAAPGERLVQGQQQRQIVEIANDQQRTIRVIGASQRAVRVPEVQQQMIETQRQQAIGMFTAQQPAVRDAGFVAQGVEIGGRIIVYSGRHAQSRVGMRRTN